MIPRLLIAFQTVTLGLYGGLPCKSRRSYDDSVRFNLSENALRRSSLWSHLSSFSKIASSMFSANVLSARAASQVKTRCSDVRTGTTTWLHTDNSNGVSRTVNPLQSSLPFLLHADKYDTSKQVYAALCSISVVSIAASPSTWPRFLRRRRPRPPWQPRTPYQLPRLDVHNAFGRGVAMSCGTRCVLWTSRGGRRNRTRFGNARARAHMYSTIREIKYTYGREIIITRLLRTDAKPETTFVWTSDRFWAAREHTILTAIIHIYIYIFICLHES